jgi:hypothetical protein
MMGYNTGAKIDDFSCVRDVSGIRNHSDTHFIEFTTGTNFHFGH